MKKINQIGELFEVQESSPAIKKEKSGGRNNHLKTRASYLLLNGSSIIDAVSTILLEDAQRHEQPLFMDKGEYPYDSDPLVNATKFVTNIAKSLGVNSQTKEQYNCKLKMRSIGELLRSEEKIEWVVDGLLTKGGLSVMAGKPKSGKSTSSRQAAISVARGEDFLGRSTTKGPVLYLALEEQVAMVRDQLKKQGAREDDDIFVHVGPVDTSSSIRHLKEAIRDYGPSIVVIDTLYHFLRVRDGNDYQQVNNAIGQLRGLARESDAHIMLIHHQNKSENKGSNSIHGSSALHGGVDSAIIFNKSGDRRFVSSTQRGGVPFDELELIFDYETETYEVGGSKGEYREKRIRNAISDFLRANPGSRKDMIRTNVQGKTEAIHRALTDMITQGLIMRESSGTSNSPYKFSLKVSTPTPSIYTGDKGQEVDNG